MKFFFILCLALLAMAATGCTALKGKAVNTGGMIYGAKVTMSDSSSMIPSVYFGIGEWWVHTIPMLAGQEYYICHTYSYFWSGQEVGKTEIYVGRFEGPGKLRVSKDEEGHLKVDVQLDKPPGG